MFTPSTNLRLLNVPLESGYTDTLWFPDVTTQTNYFLGKVVRQINDFNFIKKDNTITVNGNVESFYNCNYIMYQNANFSNKWFYAFIDRVEWASNSSTRLYCSTDAIQTWFFDITYYTSFITRQHSTTDKAGDNIVPEPINVPLGKYTSSGTTMLIQPNKINIFATCNSSGGSIPADFLDGMYSGCGIAVSTEDIATANSILATYVNNGLASAVAKIQCTPPGLDTSRNLEVTLRPSALDTYKPKNKKLLTGQFMQIAVSAMGQQLKLNPEYFTSVTSAGKVLFSVYSAVTTGEIITTAVNYGAPSTGLFCLVCKVPESTWAYNQYKNEYNLHSASNAMLVERLEQTRGIETVATIGDTVATAANTLGSIAGSIATANLTGAVAGVANSVNVARQAGKALQYTGGFDEITQQLQAIAESYSAPAVGSVTQASPFIASYAVNLDIGYLSPPKELLKIVDDYFTVYGYQFNSYGKPNLHARKCWTYIRVADLKASGDFPDEDFTDIRGAFKNGITFWDYRKTFGDYSQDNSL